VEQQQVIQQVLDAHNRAVGTAYRVACAPDQGNRRTPEVDAFAESAGRAPVATEHTKILSLQDQNRDSICFMAGLGALETELKGAFPFAMDLVFPYENVVPGQSWGAIRTMVREWLLANAAAVPGGRTPHQIAGVPFREQAAQRKPQTLPHATGTG
jgi:hypothetical protein